MLLSILVVALLVPTALLFAHTWRAEGDRAAATEREQDGVAYLRSLQQVAFAVADAQSAAVSGRAVLLVVDATASLWPVTVAAAVLRRAGASVVLPLVLHRRP